MWLPRPRAQVFAFFADPQNLPRVHPPSMRFEWLGPPPDRLTASALIDFRISALGTRTRWRLFVREFDPPFRFVDVQIWGPFARWEHRHRFAEGREAEGADAVGTWVEDRVTYRLPAGPLGRVAHALVVERQIRRLFAHRERRLRELLV